VEITLKGKHEQANENDEDEAEYMGLFVQTQCDVSTPSMQTDTAKRTAPVAVVASVGARNGVLARVR
jgi:hypothetical protein